MKAVRTRLAPSPTGFLHIGTLRTALYCYLFAKQHNGKFILRIEDTDRNRLVVGATEKILDGLAWAGISPDEGPGLGGDMGPYVQSERLDMYTKYAKQLLDEGKAYHCFCSSERLDQVRERQKANKMRPGYDGHCRNLDPVETAQRVADGEKAVIRFKAPREGETICQDMVRGEIVFKNDQLEDYVLMKSDGYPTYHLAVIVDDNAMEISHVFRTEEWLPSFPLHVHLYEAFGWEKPQWAHLPLVLNEDRTKMSKRKGDVFLHSFIDKGYLPEATVNFLALLGWNPGDDRELFTMEELIKEFSMERVHKAGAVFNTEKFDWLNGHYIRNLTDERLFELCLPYLIAKGYVHDKNGIYENYHSQEISQEYILKAIKTDQERMKRLSEVTDKADIFFAWEGDYEKTLLPFKKMSFEEVAESLTFTKNLLETLEENVFEAKDTLFNIIAPAIKDAGRKNGEVLAPLRATLSGHQNSPSPFEIMAVIGKDQTVQRIELALKKLQA